MGSKMLIDAAHAEETRVVVLKGKRIEEFDYESADRKQLKGNIYLAKVTRVEPSLQAAFVDYGGNRHGFLAFNEIHPDYYQIPVADREALIAAEREDDRLSSQDDDNEETVPANGAADDEAAASADGDAIDEENGEEDENIASVGVGDDEDDETPRRKTPRRRHYKIQEVIKRRQVILIQVVKEERGNKGAALTTYLSLAGRYCVLMPNTARGGGISRKITEPGDRKRLKDVAKNLDVPDGMGLIVRTAGAKRTKPEIKRDFDYLLRLWESVRDLTLGSTAPSLIYEEGNLIKRSIRDLYDREIDEVLVEGEQSYKEAKDFMKMLMPSHARNVKLYKEQRPLFSAHRVDAQLDNLFSPIVTLPSGGYLVINQTEALVSIDINSGKSTREHNIEDTALKTNLEAAVEISRQLRLRDLAGLVVIDFIDMDERRNSRAVERKIKDALSNDRARIQVGRISHFGLLEMSRQRMRQGMLENSTRPCAHCQGTGIIRSISSCALSVLRNIEDFLINKKTANLNVNCNGEVAFYILNEKREHLLSIEASYGISIFLIAASDINPSECQIEKAIDRQGKSGKKQATVQIDTVLGDDSGEADEEAVETVDSDHDGETDEPKRKRRRRRGRRGGRRRERETETITAGHDEEAGSAEPAEAKPEQTAEAVEEAAIIEPEEQPALEATAETVADETAEPTAEKPARKPRKPRKKAAAKERPAKKPARKRTKAKAAEETETVAQPEAAPEPVAAEENSSNGTASPPAPEPVQPDPVAADAPASEEPKWAPPQETAEVTGPPKRGWWSRR